ncbi:unnamed protein product [Effrenium voratum]|uniref:Tetratricopeptide repeat protein n=1 Tax=Effrenium voratum TaxID=2562239 RepID=A0AA36HLX2_9DINO|nr:unnamed protein product [Effrenium voratum]
MRPWAVWRRPWWTMIWCCARSQAPTMSLASWKRRSPSRALPRLFQVHCSWTSAAMSKTPWKLVMQMGHHDQESFQQALDISGTQRFAFAGVNMALAQYELKEDDQAITNLRQLLARYAEAFPDARAAYAMILWDQGDRIEAESQWDRATGTDPRYKSAQWVQEFRRWPPRMMEVFKRFADTTGVKVK